MNEKSYVLITPARNEQANIKKTIESVISQTVLPKKWLIVSDASTDGTDNIVRQYGADYDFIHFKRVSKNQLCDFGSKVNAFRMGFQELRCLQYSFIGNLDADLSFDSHYYESILQRFRQNEKLGIAGGIVLEVYGNQFRRLNYGLDSVAGCIQLFRRQAYEDIGGYVPLKRGGIDAVAEAMVRMHGWEVRTFPEIKVFHHRPIGFSRGRSSPTRFFRFGEMNYSVGYSFPYYMIRCLYKFKDKPYIVSGLLMMCGYLWSSIRREARPVSGQFITHMRLQQTQRLKDRLSRIRRKALVSPK